MNLNLGKQAESAKASEADKTPESEAKGLDGAGEPTVVTYSSYPVERFGLGPRWRFENGLLELTPAEAEEFETALASADARTKQLVKRIDADAANRFVVSHLAQATKQIDTSVNIESQAITQLGTKPVIPPQN